MGDRVGGHGHAAGGHRQRREHVDAGKRCAVPRSAPLWSGEFPCGGLAWCLNAAAITSVTITGTGELWYSPSLSEWSGIVDVEPGSYGYFPTTSPQVSQTITPGNAGDLIIGSYNGGGSGANATPAGSTLLTGSPASTSAAPAAYLFPGSTAPLSFSWAIPAAPRTSP